MKAGLTKGTVHMSNKSNPVFLECCFFIGRLCWHTGPCCKKRRAFPDPAHMFKQNYQTFERGVLCQKYCICCRHIAFSERDGRLDIRKCALHSFKGHRVYLEGILLILQGYCSCKNTLHCSKGRLHSLRRVRCISVLNIAFVGRYEQVCCNYAEDIYNIQYHTAQNACFAKGTLFLSEVE